MIGRAPDPTLARWIRPGMVLPDLTAASAAGVVEELAEAVARALPGLSAAALRRELGDREALGTTAIGHGFAVPHCRLSGVQAVDLRVARHPSGVDFGAADGAPVKVFFVIVSPSSGASAHLEALGAIARFLREPERRAQIVGARDAAELLASLQGEPVRVLRTEVTSDV